MTLSISDLSDDVVTLLVMHIVESNRPARTILRTLAVLSRTCKTAHRAMSERLTELRGLPVDVWAATSRSLAAQLSWVVGKSALEQERIYSPPFRRGPHTWRLLLFPGGDEVERHRPGAPPHLSMYVDVADAAMLPYGWVREAHFLLMVVNRRHPERMIVRYARHDFEATARDWGFRELLQLAELDDPESGFFERGPSGSGELTFFCKVWGVTDTMRITERAAQQLRGARGAGSSAVGASTASSTSVGSDDSISAARTRSVPARAISALRRQLRSLFTRPHYPYRRRAPEEVFLSHRTYAHARGADGHDTAASW
eukprot:CAMPEP_0115855930 /NCGR_PEP_ID=MMETSP0287-20121206/14793_1 /TAXON_ID=412157 /ORGANISM="Chrysochromulina rotalis, Strain UIO044" /LENGTH=313 /DNA_ID=CAMNT_0003310093 /DNA_START=72 /DNA_END=1013 /DNA_ORIENTATION=-